MLLTVPSHVASPLVASIEGLLFPAQLQAHRAALALSKIPYPAVISVTLAYPADAFKVLWHNFIQQYFTRSRFYIVLIT